MDAVAEMEADLDRLLKQKNPKGYARMIAARAQHAGEAGYTPPPAPKQPPKSEARSAGRVRVLQVSEPLDDRKIEAMTGTLIADVFDRATETLALAEKYTQDGAPVELYRATSSQAVRLIEGYAVLVEGLARFRGGCAQRVVVEYVKRVIVERP